MKKGEKKTYSIYKRILNFQIVQGQKSIKVNTHFHDNLNESKQNIKKIEKNLS